jgi:rhodanese-related sulfurtransferase
MNNNLLLLVIGAVFVFFAIRLLLGSRAGATPAEARAAVAAGTAVIVDVREPAEWASGTAEPVALLPFSDLRGARKSWKPFLEKNRDKRLYLYCASGARSGSAAALLKREGFDAVNLGGFHRWTGAGLPVSRRR